jgi:HlyD family secretion protein
MKRLFWAITLLAVILFLSGCSSSGLVLAGRVETSIFPQYSEVAGKISKLPIELGQQVKVGDLIAEIDDSNEQYALEQLNATLAKKQAILAELMAGSSSAEIKQGQNNVTLAQKALESARLTEERAKKEYANAQTLYEEGVIPKFDLDKAKYQADMADVALSVTVTQLDNAKQKLVLLREGARTEKIALAKADVQQTESQIRQTKANLEKYKIKAEAEGTIISKNYLLGNIVAPGYNLADIASENDKHLVAYLPVDYLSSISYGEELVIKNGENKYTGILTFMDLKSQYTPKDMQTSANKNKESIKIKVQLTGNSPLKVGERAELLITYK